MVILSDTTEQTLFLLLFSLVMHDHENKVKSRLIQRLKQEKKNSWE